MDKKLFKKITSIPGLDKPTDEDTERFLDVISHMESSRGQNVDHAVAEHGVSKGDKAIGRYGLMPKTKEELRNRFNELSEDSSNKEYAKKMAEMLLKKTEGDEQAASVGWRFGHNQSKEDLMNRKNEPYPAAYEKNEQELMEEQSEIPPSLARRDYSKLRTLLGK